MRKLLTAALVAFTVLGSSAALTSSAQANVTESSKAATTGVVTPQDGDYVDYGVHTVVVRMVGAPAGPYSLTVIGCRSSHPAYNESVDFDHDGTDQSYSLEIPTLTCPGTSYTATLYAGHHDTATSDSILDTNTFAVVHAPYFDSFIITDATFFPTVQDGYRDTAIIDWQGFRVAHGRTEIVNSDGVVVAARNATRGEGYWVWRGMTSDGTRVKPGDYRVRLTGWNSVGVQAPTVSKPITVKRVHRTGTMTKIKAGPETSFRTKTDNCRFVYIDDYPSLAINCDAGGHAKVGYGFRIPDGASNVAWHIDGGTLGAPGTAVRRGRFVTPHRYRVTVRVAGDISWVVTRVIVRYDVTKWW